MTVSLPLDYQRFVERLVNAGSYRSADEVVCDSLDLLRAQEVYRQERFAHLKRQVDAGIEQMRLGEVTPADPLALLNEVEQEFAESATEG
jgi:putative addiction module CopG family antidote